MLIYLTQFFKEHAMFVFIGGAARGRLQLPLIFVGKVRPRHDGRGLFNAAYKISKLASAQRASCADEV